MESIRKIIQIEEPAEAKYPQSKELFKFLKRVVMAALEVDDPEKLSDIQIGKLVGYGYEETSRWKHGRIKLDSAEKLMVLHEKLKIDEYLLLGVSTGRMDSEMAFKIWNFCYKTMNEYKKEKLIAYLKSKKIDFKLVILKFRE